MQSGERGLDAHALVCAMSRSLPAQNQAADLAFRWFKCTIGKRGVLWSGRRKIWPKRLIRFNAC